MGRIKSAAIKRTATKLVRENPDLFSGDFEKNKKVLQDLIAHKKTRNMVAGYMAKVIKRQK